MKNLMTEEEIKYELATAYVDKLVERLLEEKDSGHFVAGYLGSMIADAATRDDALFALLEEHSDLYPSK